MLTTVLVWTRLAIRVFGTKFATVVILLAFMDQGRSRRLPTIDQTLKELVLPGPHLEAIWLYKVGRLEHPVQAGQQPYRLPGEGPIFV